MLFPSIFTGFSEMFDGFHSFSIHARCNSLDVRLQLEHPCHGVPALDLELDLAPLLLRSLSLRGQLRSLLVPPAEAGVEWIP